MRLAGLSIEGQSVRAVVVERKFGKSAVVADGLTATIPQDTAGARTSLRDALNAWKREHGVKAAVVGLDFVYFTHHFIDMPVTSRADIANALRFEMESRLPLPIGEYAMDFVTVGRGASGGSRNLVFAVLRNRVDWISMACADAGVRLLGVRCSAFEAITDFIHTKPPEGSIFIYSDENAICLAGISDGAPSEIKTLHRESSPALEVKDMFTRFTGGVFSCASSGNGSPAFEALSPNKVSSNLPLLLVEGMHCKARHCLNFAQGAAGAAADEVPGFENIAYGLAAAALLLMFAAPLVSYYKDYSALGSTRKELAAIKESSKDLMRLKGEIDEAARKAAFASEFQARSNRVTLALRRLSTALPSDVWLTGFNADTEGNIQISGFARRSADIIKLLEKSEMFSSVEYASPVTFQNDRERFSIKMIMQQDAEAEAAR